MAVAVAVVMIAMLIMRVSMFMAAIFVVNVPMLYALMMIVVRHGVPFTPMVHTPLHLVCSLSLVSRLSFDARALSRARVRSRLHWASVGGNVQAMAPEILTQMILNYVVDYLMPVEYDGSAYIAPEHVNKPSLQINRLLSWEKDQAAGGVEVALAPVASFFAKVKTRDKAGRLVQYLCRMLHGILERSGNHAALQSILNKLILTVSNARRTFRVLEVGPLLTLARGVSSAGEVVAFPGKRLLPRYSRRPSTSPTGFVGCKNIDWRVVTFARRGVWQCAFSAHATLCRVYGTCCEQLAFTPETPRHVPVATARPSAHVMESYASVSTTRASNFFGFLQAGHMGKVPYVQTNNAVVGLMGVLTSSSDLWELWCKAR